MLCQLFLFTPVNKNRTINSSSLLSYQGLLLRAKAFKYISIQDCYLRQYELRKIHNCIILKPHQTVPGRIHNLKAWNLDAPNQK